MKEVEKNEIKRLSDRLDAIRHQQAELSLVEAADKYAELEKEKATLETEIERLRSVQSQKLSKEAQKLMSLPFRRAITKKEQADMGKLKKSVRGLVVVHPMTALGREMGLKEMTGFARSEFGSPALSVRRGLFCLHSPTFLPSAGSIGPTNNFIHPLAVHKSVKTHHKHVA